MFFDIFKGDKKPSNVVKFPGMIEYPRTPEVEQPKEKAPGLTTDAYYTVGVNEHGYTIFKMGHSTLSMNEHSVIALIEDLAHTIRRKYTVEITEND